MLTHHNRSPLWAILCVALAGGGMSLFGNTIYSFLASFALVSVGGLLLFDWFSERQYQMRESLIRAGHEDVEIMRLFCMLSPEAQANLQASRIIVDHVLNLDSRLDRWHIPGQPVDRLFYSDEDIHSIWDVVTEDGFAPVSTWSSGTVRREAAVSLMTYFVACGYLVPAAGNLSARWVGDGYYKARRALWNE